MRARHRGLRVHLARAGMMLVVALLVAACSGGGTGGGSTGAQVNAAKYDGTWYDLDKYNTSIPKLAMSRLVISHSGNTITVHAYGECGAGECDWNTSNVTYAGDPVEATFNPGNGETDQLSLSIADPNLPKLQMVLQTNPQGQNNITEDFTHVPWHTLAWYQIDGSGIAQLWASLGDGPAKQITHLTTPIECGGDELGWGAPVFSPDLKQIVAIQGNEPCGDTGQYGGAVVEVNVASGAVTAIPSASSPAALNMWNWQRGVGWIDGQTIWYLDADGLHQYTVGAPSAQLLSTSITNVDDAVLRGTTLFFAGVTSTHTDGSQTVGIRRFDMSAHTMLAGSISLGVIQTNEVTCRCPAAPNYPLPGWDVSADGSHVVYQVSQLGPPPPGASNGDPTPLKSQFFYANADGSGASQIASYVTSSYPVKMQLSPDGKLVAITDALPAPSLVTASVSSAGAKGDPNLTFYDKTQNPDSYPVWKWDGSGFCAGSSQTGISGATRSVGPLLCYSVGTATGAAFQPAGGNPWDTILA